MKIATYPRSGTPDKHPNSPKAHNCFGFPRNHPVIALVAGPFWEVLASYSADGRYMAGDFFERGADLIEVSPYEDLEIDDKVFAYIWGEENEQPVPRHFAGVNTAKEPLVFADGKTSHTTNGFKLVCRLVEKA